MDEVDGFSGQCVIGKCAACDGVRKDFTIAIRVCAEVVEALIKAEGFRTMARAPSEVVVLVAVEMPFSGECGGVTVGSEQ